ncbi:tetratricopeptide repeat protein [Streptomyces morookaense]|uniref:Sel1 repeat family protein n=1 Tax=Streptomyces morookaense TaxID=1970 RepID=A0A7Y7B6N3_STRMO|nr:tetratricopeptide repeat protein [Streptomyces morookaense]NVK80023.1 sel1 repeat family protein [Streptomyces morookaense]
MREKLVGLASRLEELLKCGDAEAKALLGGVLLDTGSDPARAARLFGEAAEAGVVEGKRGLGFMLNSGVAVHRDPVKANQLSLEAANSGDGYAAYNLAINYYNGHGVGRNVREFMRWLRCASERGIPEACALLGDKLSAQGHDEEALSWYVSAAESGHAPAMYVAGCWYRDGTGVDADPVQAVRWFLTMLDRGNADGIHEAIQLARGMTEAQVREAGRLARREADAVLLMRR